MNRPADVVGTFQLFADSGREGPVFSGYRPAHKLYDNYLTTGEHRYSVEGPVALGSTASVEVWFITPHVYPGSLWVGRTVEVHEGSRKVGLLTIAAVNNAVLLGREQDYRPLWTEPPGLARDGA